MPKNRKKMDNYSGPKNAEKWIYTFPKFPKKMDNI